MLKWTVRDLALRSGVHRNTVTKIELDKVIHGPTIAAVVRAMEDAGVTFLADDGKGPGVRLRKDC